MMQGTTGAQKEEQGRKVSGKGRRVQERREGMTEREEGEREEAEHTLWENESSWKAVPREAERCMHGEYVWVWEMHHNCSKEEGRKKRSTYGSGERRWKNNGVQVLA